MFRTIAFALLSALFASAQTPERLANGDISGMIKAGLPEQTIITTVSVMARRGATQFDVSPAALAALRSDGATERILDVVLWAANAVPANMMVPTGRFVAYRTGDENRVIQPLLLWAPAVPRYTGSPIAGLVGYKGQVSTLPSRLQIGESSPTFQVQGFGEDAQWELVALRVKDGEEFFRLPPKSHWGSSFFSDRVFDKRDLRPLVIAGQDGLGFSVRPAAPLAAGSYALCGQMSEGTWMRICYPFRVGGI